MVRQVKLRNRNYWAWFAKEPVGNKHGHWSEYVMHATAIACNITFVIGSSFFFSAVPEAWGPKAGATCFLVASILGSVLFFSGSFLYQGKLAACFTGMAPRIPIDQGSLQFISGSACYLTQSLLSLAQTLRLNGQEHVPSLAAPDAVKL